VSDPGGDVEELAQAAVDRIDGGGDGGPAVVVHRLGQPAGQGGLADAAAAAREPGFTLAGKVQGGTGAQTAAGSAAPMRASPWGRPGGTR
jgi:hypothetical protein